MNATARAEQLERLGVQYLRAVEFSELRQRRAEIGANTGVCLRIPVALDRGQHALVQRRGAHHVALAMCDGREAAHRDDLEIAVTARLRAPADGLVRGGVVLAAAENVFVHPRDAERRECIALHVMRFEELVRVRHAPGRGIEHRALLAAGDLVAHAAGDVEFGQAAQQRRPLLADVVVRQPEERHGGFGAALAGFEVEQQSELHVTALVVGFGGRLRVLRGLELPCGLAQQRQ
jgi:hypothetical protein